MIKYPLLTKTLDELKDYVDKLSSEKDILVEGSFDISYIEAAANVSKILEDSKERIEKYRRFKGLWKDSMPAISNIAFCFLKSPRDPKPSVLKK